MRLPSFFQTFRPLLTRLKLSGPILMIVLWVATLIWVWWQGEAYTINGYKPLATLTNRWLFTAVLIIIGISWITWKISQRLKQLEKRQQEDKKNFNSPIKENIDSQRRYLDRWVLRLQRYLDTSKYQHVLPWYLLLGIEGSGKSSLLKENGGFVELYENDDDDETNKVEFSIFTNEKAVVIVPNGNLVSQNIEVENKPRLYAKLWKNLLDWTAEQRGRQPLNGVLLCVDLYQLLTLNKEGRDLYLATLQQRLKDVSDTVNADLPIYVVLTKMDRLYGFQVMYRKLTKEQIERVLGTTFSAKGENWTQELSNFWDSWCRQMNSAMPDMMLNDALPEQRSQLFSFIRQIGGAHEEISSFLADLLNTGGKSGIFFKGVYFTSALQNGKIDDLFIQSASEQYHLSNQTYPTWSVKFSQTYFCSKLFENTLFAYPNLAKENSVWSLAYRNQVKAFSIIGGIAALGLLLGWQHYYKKNYDAGEVILTQVKNFKEIPMPKGVDYYGDKQLPLLNPMRDATFAYGKEPDSSNIFTDMGLYQGHNMGPYAHSAYLKLLQLRYLPAIMTGLQRKLDTSPPNSDEKLETLRVMRMLDDKTGRVDQVVEDYMQKYWSEAFRGQNQLQANLLSHLDYALKYTDWYAGRMNGDEELIKAFEPFDLSIRDAQKELSNLSLYDRVYQILKTNAKKVFPTDLNLREEIGGGFNALFMPQEESLVYIPRFFTTEGLTNYFLKRDSQLVDLTAIDSWVLNLTKNIEYSDADRKEISSRITEQYVNDYVSTWNDAMNNLDIKHFSSISEAVSAIEKITGNSQTIRRAISAVVTNTASPTVPKELEGRDLDVALSSSNYLLKNAISRNFLNEKSILAQEDGSRENLLQRVYPQLSNLHRYLLAIQHSPDQGKAALKAVQLRMEQQSVDPILELQQIAKGLPQPLGRWIEQLSQNAWKVVLKSAIQALEVEWNDKVVKPYRMTIADRYPFNLNSPQEVAISDFDRFFAPNGTLDSFYTKYLNAFIENGFTDVEDGSTPIIREDVLQQLEMAQKIRDTFFSGENGLGTQYIVEPFSLSANKRRSVLNLDGQIIDFTHGNKRRVNVVWPNSMNIAVESKLTLVPNRANSSPRSLSYRGPWAQIKLFSLGNVVGEREGSFDIRYDVDGGYAIYRIYVDASNNPFSPDMFKEFNLSETLY
ncbi:type VI secretion system membrane subunit TssM [Aggregatibacter actinomycetemcomitans]|uniref:type VI secretion system membrane subunit TssM n=1 Tax=Aggregatibacter actinomycetemcomitans TaxID=714 RepID=UPI00197CA4E6|nr:type VI secretion system membrane subunit TssM [Aggregatibacter actinomycetemcomitans]MBN6073742.1 type VI secretion system membrane subunit TssM [Aggregatibacter actinomycetemcomitans]